MSLTDIDALLSSAGAPSFFLKDTPVGSTVTGVITEVTGRQNTDFQSGDPKVWDDGRPQMLIAITLKTALRDHAEDDGTRGIYIKTWGEQARALKDAIKAAGGNTAGQIVVVGAQMTATFVSEIPPTKKGMSATKVYTFAFVPPALAAIDGFGGITAPPPAAPAAPPVAAPVAAAPAPSVATITGAPSPADKARQLLALGLTDVEVASATGLDPSVIAILRTAAA